MSAELMCPIHGPYDASLGSCPYCSGGSHQQPAGNRPSAPVPLDVDDLPTDLGAPASPGANPGTWGDETITDAGLYFEEDDTSETDIGFRRRSGKFLDYDDEEETSLGRMHLDDVTEIDRTETGPIAILWVKEGHRRGRIHKIKDGSVLGRNKADVIIDDTKVSSPHAKFAVREGQFVIADMLSTNGTFVNGMRIDAITPLKENDIIKIGDSIFVLKVLE